jgi:hypothetical protein
MPSTPLNVLVSSALALQKNNGTLAESAQIWLIDQKNTQSNPYYLALKDWQESPFEKVSIFSANSERQNKLAHRKAVFNKLASEIESFLPKQIAVGSDRRVEFQFVMHWLTKMHIKTNGIYLDDGLYSYAGRPYHFMKDSINGLLKKIVYGSWWREPKTVGASSWIKQAWLFAPDQAVYLLKHKQINRLEPDWFKTQEIIHLSQLVAQQLNYDTADLTSLDVILLIPHPNNIKKIPGYTNRVRRLVQRLAEQDKRIGVKYHPRSKEQDSLELASFGAKEIIPAQMAFEFCLPVFNKECHIVGDVGTALFTCKWLRPDLKVTAVLDENDEFQQRFISISQIMGIHVMNQIEDVIQC